METLGIKRFKRHQVLIQKEVDFYVTKMKQEFYDDAISDDMSDDAIDSLDESIDSDALNEKFTKI